MATKKTEEIRQWLDLCEWLEINVFNYDIAHGQRLQTDSNLILRGLKYGQKVANSKQKKYCEYPFNVILMTFKANKILIQNAIKNKTFESERQKMSYVCAIVRDRIDDIYKRYLNTQKTC